eukprot:CAMPEP_0198281734 /NCGR_PEP_ID=MMETSP1449-20131203/1623_1 /TAXON_ID=420275 /ORGANISM="Attheya septentrionalis, Strain CCMP2084" /LENGTH=493 /DNA_ID=CAMNT_0043977637 /DNA_START=222 /DNA_END=1700 /DNA_ORIENTATION=+
MGGRISSTATFILVLVLQALHVQQCDGLLSSRGSMNPPKHSFVGSSIASPLTSFVPRVESQLSHKDIYTGFTHTVNPSSRSHGVATKMVPDIHNMMPTETIAFIEQFNLNMDKDAAEMLAGPFFGLSLFPYLAFLYFLNVEENECPKGVVVGFATCLLFVFLTIPAAIAAKVLYDVSLADSDWLHGSAESLLTVTNLVTVVAFRQALNAKEQNLPDMPVSATSYEPMTWLVVGLTALAGLTAAVPALAGAGVHTPYLGGFMDLPTDLVTFSHTDPENSLTVACWIIHVSSLVEFLVAMGFAWRWADVSGNPKWKGLTWGLLPLHSSGITACTYHLFYNQVPIMVPLQAFLTLVGNTTAAYAAYRIAISNGWTPPSTGLAQFLPSNSVARPVEVDPISARLLSPLIETPREESASLVGFEDLGDALAADNDYSFLLKLFFGSALASYAIKYGELLFDFPFNPDVYLSFAVVGVPSALNAFKWYKRSKDPSFEGW